jgi:DNA-binding CsgD family transcriptional regulator
MRLSPRQKQIANLIADDVEAPEIARRLGIGVGSVRTQIVRMKAKRGWHTRLDIARWVWSKRDAAPRIYKGIQTAT